MAYTSTRTDHIVETLLTFTEPVEVIKKREPETNPGLHVSSPFRQAQQALTLYKRPLNHIMPGITMTRFGKAFGIQNFTGIF